TREFRHFPARHIRRAESPRLRGWTPVHHAEGRQDRGRVHRDSERLRRVALRGKSGSRGEVGDQKPTHHRVTETQRRPFLSASIRGDLITNAIWLMTQSRSSSDCAAQYKSGRLVILAIFNLCLALSAIALLRSSHSAWIIAACWLLPPPLFVLTVFFL